MKAVLDAGAFLAVEKRDRRMGAMLRVLQQRRVPLSTSSAVVAQVWRDGRKQARLAQMLAAVGVRPLAPDDDRRTGELLALAHRDDVIDAHLALTASDGDRVLTSDPVDLHHLMTVRAIHVTLVTV